MNKVTKICISLVLMIALGLLPACGNHNNYNIHDIVIGERRDEIKEEQQAPEVSDDDSVTVISSGQGENNSTEITSSEATGKTEKSEGKEKDKTETKTSTSNSASAKTSTEKETTSTSSTTTTSTSASTSTSTSTSAKTSTSISTGEHEHSFGEWSIEKEAKCGKEGRKVRYCSCGKSEYEVIPALVHSYGEWQQYTKATIDQEGKEVRYCNYCGNPEYQTIPKLPSYTLEVHFYDSETGEEVPQSAVSYGISSNGYSSTSRRYSENAFYHIEVSRFYDVDYKIPEPVSGNINSDLSISITLYPKYRYEETTATVATVKNGGIFYCIDGKYYTVTVKEKSSTSQQPWKNVLSYYANGTFLQEQIIPWMSYDDPCELAPIYTRYEN